MDDLTLILVMAVVALTAWWLWSLPTGGENRAGKEGSSSNRPGGGPTEKPYTPTAEPAPPYSPPPVEPPYVPTQKPSTPKPTTEPARPLTAKPVKPRTAAPLTAKPVKPATIKPALGCRRIPATHHGQLSDGECRPVTEAESLVYEFQDASMGVAFSMLPTDVFDQKGTEVMDQAVFFHLDEEFEYHAASQQAVTVVTADLPMNPYIGPSPPYGRYGIVFHLTEDKEFWKYFQVTQLGSNAGSIVGGPGDGANHTPPDAAWRHTLLRDGKSYAWFAQQKNAILKAFDTVYRTGHDYNEFDTNGLSPNALAGIFVDETSNRPTFVPSDEVQWRFLTGADPKRTSWPVYGYSWGSLYIKYFLSC